MTRKISSISSWFKISDSFLSIICFILLLAFTVDLCPLYIGDFVGGIAAENPKTPWRASEHLQGRTPNVKLSLWPEFLWKKILK